MQGYSRTVAVLLVVLLFCAAVFGQTDKAILYSGQGAKLNGAAISTSSAVISGDNVETANTGAQLTARGLVAQIEPATSLKWGDVIVLSCGGVTLNSESIAVQASDTRITPVNGTSNFNVINRGGKLSVHVQSGTVRVGGEETTMLSAGQSVERPSTDSCPALASGSPAGAAHAGKGKWIGVAAAGGGAAAAAVIIGERKPASASKP